MPATHPTHPTHGGGNSYRGRGARLWTNDDELDVRFFFCDAAGCAAHLRSNMGVQLEARRLGLSRVEARYVDPDGEMVARLDHAARASRVQRTLRAIGQEHAATLAAVYGGETPPAKLRERCGDELAAVVYLMSPGVRACAWKVSHELLEAAGERLTAAKEAYAIARAGRA